ncbi:MAG: hypothetical protein CMI60_17230 [Parvibaculum sp.]|jgi:hypothetical protein|nr:hypothetical protein [Parvibaculum sp.]|tara:strand:+ start:303 stop:740 length:438 start_codon:yes stop_codon:yes gene_type:complete
MPKTTINSLDNVTAPSAGAQDQNPKIRQIEARCAALDAKIQAHGCKGSLVTVVSDDVHEGFEGRITWSGIDRYREGVEKVAVAFTKDFLGDDIVKSPDEEYGPSAFFDRGQVAIIEASPAVEQMLNMKARYDAKIDELLAEQDQS